MIENGKIKEEDKNKYLESILFLEEFISVEDYSTYNMAKASMVTGCNNSSPRIRLLFQNDENKSIEEFVYKKDMEKIYEHIKIYEPKKQNYINIFVLREENSIINGITILNKINDKPFLKPTIVGKFKIKEFPLKNYSLEQINNEGEIKSYILKKNENKENMKPKTHLQKYYNGYTLCRIEEFIDYKNNNNQNGNNNKKLSSGAYNNNNNNSIIQTNYTNIPTNQMNPNLNNNMYPMNNGMINYNNMNAMISMNNNMNQNKNATNNNYMNPMFLNQNNIINNNNNLINITISGVCCPKGYEKEFSEIGLNNVGLTCYMNSTLQLLLHIPELNSFFVNIYPAQKNELEKINKDADTRGRLSEEYCELVNRMIEKNNNKNQNHHSNHNYYNYNSISPKDFNDLLSRVNPQFAKFESNDSKDLLLYLIQSMHAELNYKGAQKLSVPKCNQTIELDSFNFFMKVNSELNLSIFSYLFYGIIKSSTICSGCNNELYNYQYFQFLSFPTFDYVKKKFNLYSGLKDFTKVETMKGDNQCYCQKCRGLRDAKVKSILFYTPPYLLINFDYGKNKKFSPSKVEFGEYIDLTGFTEVNCTEKTYSLIGISTHIGTSGNSGHYIAYCKDVNNKQWYKFNDSIVSKCSYDEVNSNTPYLLVFKKGTHDLLY